MVLTGEGLAFSLPLPKGKENTMKTAIHLYPFLFVALFAVGCTPKSTQKKVKINNRGGDAVQAVTQTPTDSSTVMDQKADEVSGVPGSKKWGSILRNSSSQAVFQSQVQAFVSNLTGPNNETIALGQVSGDANQVTGVRFWGAVGLNSTNGVVSLNGQNNFQVTSQGSALRLSIFDSYVGQTNSKGEKITEIPIYIAPDVEGFVNVTGRVYGNQAEILYQDSYGQILLTGTFNSNWFQGQVQFQNNNPSVSGTLGTFVVPTCGFFKCQ